VDPELLPHAMSFADPMQSDPRPGSVRQIVVAICPRWSSRAWGNVPLGNTRPRAFASASSGTNCDSNISRLASISSSGLRPTKPHTAFVAEQNGGIEYPQHEIVLTRPRRSIRHQHIVEIPEIRKTHSSGVHGGQYPVRTLPVERLPQVERVRDGIQQRLRRQIRVARMQCGRQLNVGTIEAARELEPFLDGQVRIGVALVARCQFLQGRGQYAQLHRLGLKTLGCHGAARSCALVSVLSEFQEEVRGGV